MDAITYKLSNQEVTSPVAWVQMNYVCYPKSICTFPSAMRHYFSFIPQGKAKQMNKQTKTQKEKDFNIILFS